MLDRRDIRYASTVLVLPGTSAERLRSFDSDLRLRAASAEWWICYRCGGASPDDTLSRRVIFTRCDHHRGRLLRDRLGAESATGKTILGFALPFGPRSVALQAGLLLAATAGDRNHVVRPETQSPSICRSGRRGHCGRRCIGSNGW